jgi:hypothetical protein
LQHAGQHVGQHARPHAPFHVLNKAQVSRSLSVLYVYI